MSQDLPPLPQEIDPESDDQTRIEEDMAVDDEITDLETTSTAPPPPEKPAQVPYKNHQKKKKKGFVFSFTKKKNRKDNECLVM